MKVMVKSESMDQNNCPICAIVCKQWSDVTRDYRYGLTICNDVTGVHRRRREDSIMDLIKVAPTIARYPEILDLALEALYDAEDMQQAEADRNHGRHLIT